MGQFADLLAIRRTIEFKGKTYTLYPFDCETQGRFERWCEEQGAAAVKRLRPLFSEDEYREERAQLRRDVSADEYAFGGKVFAKQIQSINGKKAILKIMLRDYPEFTDAMIDELFVESADEVMQQIAADSSPKATTETTTKAENG